MSAKGVEASFRPRQHTILHGILDDNDDNDDSTPHFRPVVSMYFTTPTPLFHFHSRSSTNIIYNEIHCAPLDLFAARSYRYRGPGV